MSGLLDCIIVCIEDKRGCTHDKIMIVGLVVFVLSGLDRCDINYGTPSRNITPNKRAAETATPEFELLASDIVSVAILNLSSSDFLCDFRTIEAKRQVIGPQPNGVVSDDPPYTHLTTPV